MQIPTQLDDASKDPLPLPVRQSRLWIWITPALSVAILAVVAWNFRSFDIQQLHAAVPTNPFFWVIFFAYYFTGIIFDFLIFRWLWGIPAEGVIALARKNVTNELIVDYLGEAYFYSWARRKLRMESSPFGAVKDVAILSAVVANVFTLAMMAFVYPYARDFNIGLTSSALAGSIGVIMVISIIVALFSRRIFSLTRRQLIGISGLHVARLIFTNGLLALAWSIALPDVAVGWWLLLATAKMLLSRLPLISNKDVIFAAVAVLAVGRDTDIQLLIALMTTLILLTHLTIGAALAIGDLVTIAPKSKEAKA
ncbi:MAG: hypothetical protein KKD64_14110 [Alphaproteobacteria bacterium]|nr:hypothetical protein [Alphaproteobacteria bacterium]MBU0795039.1 hypothetical protein [Alphaproteobacteria bacterium]MBU0877197.1 hypothetical protein [Alphaproteobacteria bacterium]MBU1770772.1 hypothetical protein [Alphaproteobacteria bacterium]